MASETQSGHFLESAAGQPHPQRTKAILAAHPDVRRLFGRNAWTGAILLAIVVLQTGLAAAFGHLGAGYVWASLLTAYLVGAFANHSLYVIVHEATHNLIFRSRFANKCAAIVADLPNVFPGAMGFGIFHLQHHAHQGEYEHDADLASEWEARLIGNRWYMKAVWLLLFPFFQLSRPARLKSYTVFTRWTVANGVAAIVYGAAIVMLFGWWALFYLFASMMFSIGLHPLGARWIQEHYTKDPRQETFSYYGALNRLALNVGYHNEHHDFPSIPWNRLPALRRLCPEFYDTLKSHDSWTKVLLQFIFDKEYSLHSRVLRDPPVRAAAVAAG